MDLQAVISVLDGMLVGHVTDATTPSLAHVRTPAGRVTIVTSPAAIRDYDPYHPERILCIILRQHAGDFYVVVKDRDVDLSRSLPFWWKRERLSSVADAECVVCFKKRNRFTCCFHCHALLCTACHARIHKDKTATKCTLCRSWSLTGDGYGRPWEGPPIQEPLVGRTPVDKLIGVLARLDGDITIVPRVDREFLFDRQVGFSKLAFTDRYARGSMRIRDVRAKLERLCAHHTDCVQLLMYVIRKTHRISDAPVDEVSVFQVQGGELLAFGNDDFIVTLVEDDVNFVKTELVTPSKRVVPPHVYALFAEINAAHPHSKTISVVMADETFGMNFDVDAGGNITTINTSMLVTNLANMLASGRDMYVTCRIFRYKNRRFIDFNAYKLDNAGFKKLDNAGSRAIFNKNIDGLGGGRRIRSFV
jgi:hypothetical protein